MPYRFEFDPANRIIRCRLDGKVTDEELTGCYRDADRYARQTDPLVGIMDMSAVSSFVVSANTISKLALSTPAMPHPERLRILIAPAPEIFGIARMFEVEGQELRPDLHVVHSEKEALAILELQETRFEPIQLK